MSKKYETDEIPDHGHNIFADNTDRFRLDQLLRAYGFRIHGRPKGGEPTWLWANDGKVYTQTSAVASTGDSEVRAAHKRSLAIRKRLEDEQRQRAG